MKIKILPTLASGRQFSPPLKFLLLLFLAGGMIFSVGCGKKPAAADTVGQSAAPVPANSGPAAGQPPRVVPVVVAENVDASAQLAQLTQVLRRYGVEHRRVPQSLSELVAAGYLAALPAAPAGKQFAIDAKSMLVMLQKK